MRGGHARGHNPRTIGVALLGDYTRPRAVRGGAAPPWSRCWPGSAARWGLDPQGESAYVLVVRRRPDPPDHRAARADPRDRVPGSASRPARARTSARAPRPRSPPRPRRKHPRRRTGHERRAVGRAGVVAAAVGRRSHHASSSSPRSSSRSASGSSPATTRSRTGNGRRVPRTRPPAPALGDPDSPPPSGTRVEVTGTYDDGRRSAPAQSSARRRRRLRRAHATAPRRRHRRGRRSRMGRAQPRRRPVAHRSRRPPGP